jgi:putative membrane protein
MRSKITRTTLLACSLAAAIPAAAHAQTPEQAEAAQPGSKAYGGGVTGEAGTGSMKGQGAEAPRVQPGAPLAKSDREFLEKATQHTVFSVELNRMASERVTEPELKTFAQQNFQQQQGIATQLENIARTNGVQVASAPTKKELDEIEKLRAMPTADLGKKYLDKINEQSKQSVNQYEKFIADTKSTELKQFATSSLPIWKKQQDGALRLRQQIEQAASK